MFNLRMLSFVAVLSLCACGGKSSPPGEAIVPCPTTYDGELEAVNHTGAPVDIVLVQNGAVVFTQANVDDGFSLDVGGQNGSHVTVEWRQPGTTTAVCSKSATFATCRKITVECP